MMLLLERSNNWLKLKSSTKNSLQKKRLKRKQIKKKLQLMPKTKQNKIREMLPKRDSRSCSRPLIEEKQFKLAPEWVNPHQLVSPIKKASLI
jgi:hypothetical protein